MDNDVLADHEIHGVNVQLIFTLAPLFGKFRISATESDATKILPLPGNTSSDLSASKQSTISHVARPTGRVAQAILSNPSKFTSFIFLCWSSVNIGYNLTSLAGDALFFRDFKNKKISVIKKRWQTMWLIYTTLWHTVTQKKRGNDVVFEPDTLPNITLKIASWNVETWQCRNHVIAYIITHKKRGGLYRERWHTSMLDGCRLQCCRF